jgi:hypothetical protein
VSWWSKGAASTVATKLALDEFRKGKTDHDEFVIGYCEVKEEHPDGDRFLKECEAWFDHPITIMGNDNFDRSIYEVFRKTGYLVGLGGARCTRELKKQVRQDFERIDDAQVFGYTSEEGKRVDRFIDANNDVDLVTPLLDRGLSKNDCLGMIDRAGIELPAMYKLGYHNNNCLGCVKGESGYWNKIRVDFPEVFARSCAVERAMKRTICKVRMPTVAKKYPEIYKNLGRPDQVNAKGNPYYWRPYLDELPEDMGDYPNEQSVECGIFCLMAEGEYIDSGQ